MKAFYKDRRFWFISITSIIALCLYFFWDSSFLVRSIATVAFLFIFYAGDRVYKINFTNKHYFYFILLVVAGILAAPLYFIWPQYDKIQHLVMPIFMSTMTFYMIDKLPLKNKWKIWYTFFIVVALLGIFELVEYSIDTFFDFKLQGVFLRDVGGIEKLQTIQGPHEDTMIDLIFGVIGATVYLLYKGTHTVFRRQ